MILWTLVWLFLPFFLAFLAYIIPQASRYFALLVTVIAGAYTASLFIREVPLSLNFIDSFGIQLTLDPLAGFFILTNALVTAAVLFYCWQSDKVNFFYIQLLILHGSLNAAFACTDFMSLYVALEVLSIATFLLIAYPRSDRSIWIGLRYLFVSNVVMLFYLVGAVLVYQSNQSFHFSGLQNASPEAIALIFLGLLVKGGVFISGLWLPLTHAESDPPVSALMSGVVVKAGILPLLRCALLLEAVDPIVRLLGVCTALFGITFAIFEQDTKRTLAFSTISQMGFILAAPVVGGFYALTHGLVKASLFLTAGQLPSRKFQELQQRALPRSLWLVLLIASFSISGFPFLAGYGAKVLTLKNVLSWQDLGMNLAAVGTAVCFARFIFLPHQSLSQEKQSWQRHGFWLAIALLFTGLVTANVVYYEAYTLANVVKPLVTIAIGWLAYAVIIRKLVVRLPKVLEKLEHLIGMMLISLTLVFWMYLV